MPSVPLPAFADVVIVGCGPAGSATATWLAGAGRDVLVIDSARFPRDKACGDGLTPRAMAELDRLGAGAWVAERSRIDGLELTGFRNSRRVPWPSEEFPPDGAAVPRTEFDDHLRSVAVDAGATVVDGVRATGVERDGSGRVTAVTVRSDDPGTGDTRVGCGVVIDAGGVRSPLGRHLGRTWHRDTVFAVAARSYIRSEIHDRPWIGSHLELRDAEDAIQPGYGWVFPLSNGDVNLGVGALATEARPANVKVKDLLQHYARQVRGEWRLTGEPRDVRSALLPMGGAVSGVAGPNWAMVGDAAACVNPLNGEGIDYALGGGRLLAELIEAGGSRAGRVGGGAGVGVGAGGGAGAGGPFGALDLTHAWPEVLREHYGHAFTIARDLAWLLTVPRFLPAAGPVGMSSQTLMAAAVRCMSNSVGEDDPDLVARAWRAAGGVARRLDRRPLWSPAE